MALSRGLSTFPITAFVLAIMLLSGCMHTSQHDKKPASVSIEHTPLDMNARMASSGYAQSPYNQSTAGMVDLSGVLSSDNVQVFPLEGQTPDPFAGSRKRRSVFENTTSGGYTVLDQNVMVFPLEDGERPSYLPPFEGAHSAVQQYAPRGEQAMIGSPLNRYGAPGSAAGVMQERSVFNSADDLPPIKQAPRLTMPAPSKLKAPKPSPFQDGKLLPQGWDTTPPVPGAPATAPEIRPIGSSLTGYQEHMPTTLSQRQRRSQKLDEYRTLAERAGSTSQRHNATAGQEPIAIRQRWATASPQNEAASVPAVPSVAPQNSGSPMPLPTPQASGAPIQMAPVMNENLNMPTEQPRRTPRRGGMLTGY